MFFYVLMLNKTQRLTKNKEFEGVLKNGSFKNSKLLKVAFLKNTLSKNQYGVIVSNKISPKAVIRNKIKRQIKYLLKKHEQKIIQGNNIVIITHPSIKKEGVKQIESTLAYMFNSLKLLKK